MYFVGLGHEGLFLQSPDNLGLSIIVLAIPGLVPSVDNGMPIVEYHILPFIPHDYSVWLLPFYLVLCSEVSVWTSEIVMTIGIYFLLATPIWLQEYEIPV
jgi:hypothetical protein